MTLACHGQLSGSSNDQRYLLADSDGPRAAVLLRVGGRGERGGGEPVRQNRDGGGDAFRVRSSDDPVHGLVGGVLSGAVSLGGLAAVFVSPIVGRWLDRYGAGVILGVGSLATGVVAIGLAFVAHPMAFYARYVPGRMICSGPLEMGLPTAISNWFIRRRPVGLAVDHIAEGTGLAIVPWAMTLIITGYDWRTAWITLGIRAPALSTHHLYRRWHVKLARSTTWPNFVDRHP